MIRTVRHRGLERLYEKGDVSRLRADRSTESSTCWGHLDQARNPVDLSLPGYRLHPLKGLRKNNLVELALIFAPDLAAND